MKRPSSNLPIHFFVVSHSCMAAADDQCHYEYYIERSPKNLASLLEELKKIDKFSFEKSDNLVELSIDELTKKTVTVFLAKATSSTRSECKIIGYLLYSHTKMEGFSRIIKVIPYH